MKESGGREAFFPALSRSELCDGMLPAGIPVCHRILPLVQKKPPHL